MSIEIGDKAPDFTLSTDGNGKVTLSKLRGQKVVLYFYPKDDTTGCTAEACGFRDSFPKFGKIEAAVIGISKGSVASHDRFKKKYELPFILASDADGKVCEAYGVWVEKSMYGRNTWESSAPRSSSTRRVWRAACGTRSKCPAMSTRCSPR